MNANTVISAAADFFLKDVAGLPVWAFFAIGAAIIIIAVIAICAAVGGKKSKAKKAQNDTNAVEIADAPVEVKSQEPEVDATQAEISKETAKQKAAPEDAQAAASIKADAEKAPAEKPAAQKKTGEAKKAAATTAPKTEKEKDAAAPKIEKIADKAPVKKAEKPAEKTTAKKAETGDKTPVKKPSAKGKAPVAIPVDATKKPAKILLADNGEETFGKYQVFIDNPDSERPYKFRLLANNGQMLFESDSFKIKPTARNINAFKNNVKEGEFAIEDDPKSDTFYVKLYSKSRALIGLGESYTTKAACESSIDSIKRFAESAIVVEDLTVAD